MLTECLININFGIIVGVLASVGLALLVIRAILKDRKPFIINATTKSVRGRIKNKD